MPLKKNKSGKLQYYDPHTGRYGHMDPKQKLELFIANYLQGTRRPKLSRKERLELTRNALEMRAKNSDDAYLYTVFKTIDANFNYCIQNVNQKFFDENLNGHREFDIVTKHTIIEIKSGKATKKSKQLLGQQQYAKAHNKAHIVYAPEISYATKREYVKMGLCITTTMNELLNELRRYEK